MGFPRAFPNFSLAPSRFMWPRSGSLHGIGSIGVSGRGLDDRPIKGHNVRVWNRPAYLERGQGLGFMREADAVLAPERYAETAKATMRRQAKRRIGTAVPAEITTVNEQAGLAKSLTCPLML
jgi:hypothetical protein